MEKHKKIGVELSYNEMKSITGGNNPTCNKKACYVTGTNKASCMTGGGYLSHCVTISPDHCTPGYCRPYDVEVY